MKCPNCGYEDHEDQFDPYEIECSGYIASEYECPMCFYIFEIEE
jgi:rubredoxin